MKTAEKKTAARLFELSALNVFFCLLVIFIHASSNPVSVLDRNTWQYLIVMVPWRLAGFAVHGFIFLSGLKLFLNKSDDFSYRKFILNRLRLIVIPYILWVFIFYLFFCAKNYFAFNILDLLRYIYVGDLVSIFYFVIIIMQFYLLAPLWMRLIKNTNPTAAILFSLMLTIILGSSLPSIIKIIFPSFDFAYNDRVFTTYLIYWTAGCYMGFYYKRFKNFLYKNRLFIIIIFAVSSVSNIVFSYLQYSGRSQIHFLENIHTMYCMSAVLFFIMISVHIAGSKRYAEKGLCARFVNSVDRISYKVYLSHCLIIFITDDVLKRLGSVSVGINYIIRLISVYVITIGGLLLYRKMISLIKSKVK